MTAGILLLGCETHRSQVGVETLDRTSDNIELTKGLLPLDFDLSSEDQPLFDALADDVMLKVTIREGSAASGEVHGKQAVIESFKKLGHIAHLRQEAPQQYLGNGDRVVVLGDGSFDIKKSDATSRSEYAIVVDYREGLISRILILQNFEAIADAYRASWQEVPTERSDSALALRGG